MKRFASLIPLVLVLISGATGAVLAENMKGRWQLGGGFSWLSTTDDIRSNAAFVFFNQPGPDGIPDTGDETILFSDPRPDDTLSRETTLNEGLKVDFNVSYGVTEWLSLQLDASYYEADIVQFDTWVRQREFVDFNRDGIWELDEVDSFSQSQPIVAGSMKQIPVSLTAVFRFRRDSPLNPYVGIGGGYIFTETTTSAALDQINQTLSEQEIITVGTNNFFPDFAVCQGINCPEFQAYTLAIEDSTEWHVSGGAEYFFNSKLSIYFDAKYMFANSVLVLRSGAFEQDQLHINYTAVSDTLPFCGDTSIFDPADFPPGFSPIDNGIPGACRPGNPPSGPNDPENRLVDEYLIQGGSIGLTNFSVGVGLRWSF